MITHIRELYIFPIKSAAPVAVTEMVLGPRGPKYDRHWMIVDDSGKFVTQRENGILAQLQPKWAGGSWYGKLPDGEVLPLSAEAEAIHAGTPMQDRIVTVWKDSVPAWDCGERWRAALRRNFLQNWHLVEMKEQNERWLKNPRVTQPQPISFADAEPILVVNQSSVEALESRLNHKLGALRFRPNIVITGLPAFGENQVQQWKMGGRDFNLSKLCSRCVMITLNPETGRPDVPTLLKELAKDQLIEGKIRFGVHIVPETAISEPFTLRLGDIIEV